jgi:hypothetical protein
VSEKMSSSGEMKAIEADIDATRERMGETLEELGSRLNPGYLKDEAIHAVKDATIGRVRRAATSGARSVRSTGRRLGVATKRNPLPAALIGGGVVLMFLGAWSRRKHR